MSLRSGGVEKIPVLYTHPMVFMTSTCEVHYVMYSRGFKLRAIVFRFGCHPRYSLEQEKLRSNEPKNKDKREEHTGIRSCSHSS